MGVKVITAAAGVVPTADLRAQLRIDSTDEDALLAGYLAAAQAFAQHYTGRAIGPQTLELALDAFPSGSIVLPIGPATGITAVKYIDAAGVEQTVAPSNYALDDYGRECSVVLAYGAAWPSARAAVNAVKVRYAAGDAVTPPAVVTALLLLVGHYYENREDATPVELKPIPAGATALLDTVRIWSF